MMDSGIKLFGKKITFPEKKNTTDLLPLLSTATATATATAGEESGSGTGGSGLEEEKLNGNDPKKVQMKEQNSEAKTSNKSTASLDGGATVETGGEEPKALKKPDKILPCPRCTSMDTKFCYYNNYNVHQPRHFCKSCQRYWTAGGTMRSMPVGAGRRKNKIPVSQVCQFVQETPTAYDGGVSSKLLNFGSNSSCVDGLRVGRENGDDCSSGSTVTTSNSATENANGLFPGVPWSYNPWNSVICPPGYPIVPIYPSPYWNYIHWLPIQNQNAQCLGKHPRDSESISPNDFDELKKPKNSVLTPKTLRIDDPEEAAKSSIWATLGIKNENVNCGLFKDFQEKGAERKRPSDTDSQVLHANPAAFSRSICFRERA